MKKYFYSLEEFWNDVNALHGKIKTLNKKFANIAFIPRGGLVPAGFLCHLLDLPVLMRESDIGGDTILVDDIADSGMTMLRLLLRINGYPENYFQKQDVSAEQKKKRILEFFADPSRNLMKPLVCSLYYHRDSLIVPDIWIREKKEWIVFPWETESSSRYDGTI